MLKIRLEIPVGTSIQFYFQTIDHPVFNETNSVRRWMKKGINTLCFLITDKNFNGQLRIDPGNAAGVYIIHEIEVKKAPGLYLFNKKIPIFKHL